MRQAPEHLLKATGARRPIVLRHARRNALAPGACFDGPAIVAEAETSTLAGPGWTGRITAEGYIEPQRELTQ
jgi:N-methylhydantoinase A/oxoprolinase/acetone carboxylase beta subunit